MNIVSNHNRLLRGAAIPTAGGDVYNSGWEYTPEGEISGYSGSAIYTGEGCQCDSAAIVDSAFNQSTAWVDEQNYLTAHQDVTNLPYVQNSALEFSPQGLISGISGSGLYATSAENAFTADTAYFAYNSEHADSADYTENAYSAQFANSASSALNAEVANVAYTALTANFLDGGWERDEDGFITAYNNTAFAGAGGGGRYEGIEPIVVNNEEMRISAKSAVLGVQEPLYFVEDSETATVIGIQESAISGKGIEYSGIAPIVVDNENHLISAQSAKLGVQGPLYFVEDTPTSTVIGIDNSAFPTFEGTPEGKISAINGSALNADPVIDYSAGNNIDITDHVISVTGSVPSADRAAYAVSATSAHYSHSAIEAASANSATYDNLGREITATYLTAVTGDNTPYSAGANIDITNHVVSGKDWTDEIQAASANAVNEATNTITAVQFANSASALTTSAGWDVTEYTAGANIDITNHVVSGKDWTSEIANASAAATAQIPDVTNLDYVQNSALNIDNGSITSISSYNVGHPQVPVTGSGSVTISKPNGTVIIHGKEYDADITAASSYAYEQATAQIPDVTNLPYVQNTALESNGILISAISGSGLYATSADNAFEADHSYEADYVLSGWEYDDEDRISAYNGSAFAGQGGGQGVEYTGIAPIVVNNVEHKISAQSAVLGVQSPLYFVEDSETATVIGISGDLTGQYIPYTNIFTGDSGTTLYELNSGIRVTATSGWVELYNQNKENENEAHLQIGQNYANGKSFWAELDGAGGGILQMNWNSGTISPNSHVGYADGTCSALDFGNGSIVYASATSALGDNYDSHKVWQLGSYRLRFWDSAGNTAAVFGPEEYSAWNDTRDTVSANSAEWGKTYSGISPIIVDNAERTIDISGYGLSGINLNIWKDDVHHVIVISAAPGGASIDYTTGSI